MSSPIGLCERCRHQRLVPNTRGSVFSLCERSRSDERFPRYPRLPVLDCVGFEPRAQGEGEAASSSPSGPVPRAG
ncbi:MAG TPA: hypothetical protein VGI73_13155 [Solirubrobacterales bacterium]